MLDQGGADALPVGVVRLSERGIISSTNAWFADWVGTSIDGIVGKPIDEFLEFARDDLFPPGEGPGPWVMLHSRAPERAVMVSRHQDDSTDVLLISEATDRFRALSELRRQYALADRTRTRLELIMDSAVAFSTAATEGRLAEVLANTATRAYRADESTVYLYEPEGDHLLAAGPDPLGDGFGAAAITALVSAPRRVVKVVDRLGADGLLPGLGDAMDKAGIRAFIAGSLHHEESDFGAFVSWFRHERYFDDEAAPLAEAIAGQAAQTLATLRLQTRLAHAAMHDEVTGLPNRRQLEALAEALTYSTGYAALFIDLDDFKRVNDQYGHHAGDRMLRRVADRLLTGVRAEDLVARYGGDEFVVIAREVPDEAVAVDIAERILEALRGEGGNGAHGSVSASIGVAIAAPGSRLLVEQLIRRADLAMYRAKAAGGDRIVVADH